MIMNKNINIALVGIGNCSASLIMGLEYYKNVKSTKERIIGLMHNFIGKYVISDIKPIIGFDVDRRKIGKDISEAIFQIPNNTKKFCDIQYQNCLIMKGPILDGVADHMRPYFQVADNQKELSKEDIISTLKNKNIHIIINYAPVGSQKLTEFWANIALESGCAFLNCIPVFIASNPKWSERFRQTNLPIIGDDIKSQCGSTIVNRSLVQMIQDRGGKIVNSWQSNFGGNTDFLNMSSQDRLESKKISKTESISSLIPDNHDQPYVYAGPSGYIQCLNDNKISHMKIDFKIFGDIDCSVDIKLSVEDSPNSAGCVIDCIRLAKIALDRKIGGPLIGPSAYYMKHPARQYSDNIAYQMVEEFINGDREN